MSIRFDSKPKEEERFLFNFFTGPVCWVTHYYLWLRNKNMWQTNTFAIPQISFWDMYCTRFYLRILLKWNGLIENQKFYLFLITIFFCLSQMKTSERQSWITVKIMQKTMYLLFITLKNNSIDFSTFCWSCRSILF